MASLAFRRGTRKITDGLEREETPGIRRAGSGVPLQSGEQ